MEKPSAEEGAEEVRAVSNLTGGHRKPGIPVLKVQPGGPPMEDSDEGARRGGNEGGGQGPNGVILGAKAEVKLKHSDQGVHPFHKGREAQDGKPDTTPARETT